MTYVIAKRTGTEFLAGHRAVKSKMGRDYIAPNWTTKKSAAERFASKEEAESKVRFIFGGFAPSMFESLRLMPAENGEKK